MDLNEVIKQLTAERDALAAQVEALRDTATDAANALGFLSHHLRGRVGEAALLDMAEKADAVSEALSITPQQCLAVIRAEAYEAGFSKAKHVYKCDLGYCSTDIHEWFSEWEAAKVRQGGE